MLKTKRRRRVRIVRQPIGTITDRNAAEQRFVRAAIDAHPRTATIGREKEVLLAIDQNTGDAWHIWQGTQIAICVTVDDVNAIGARMSHVQARHYRRLAPVDVGVVETWLLPRGDRNKTYSC